MSKTTQNRFAALANIPTSDDQNESPQLVPANDSSRPKTNKKSHDSILPPHPSKFMFKPMVTKGIKIAHINVRSLYPKIDEIRLIVKDNNLDIFAVSETWLSDAIPNGLIDINGYTIFRRDRIGGIGGGVALYIRTTIQHTICDDLISEKLENIWVHIKHVHFKPFLVSCFYRPPSSNKEFIDDVIECVEKANQTCEDIIFLGDFNYNFNIDEINMTDPCVRLQQLTGARQLIESPTRVTETSSTIIDHIYTTLPNKHIRSGVIETSLSDHYLIYTILNSKHKTSPPKEIKIRCYKNFSTNAFIDEIANSRDLNIDGITTVDDAWEKWSKAFLDISNKHAPIKTIRVKDRNNPWVSREILNLMYQRDKIHKKAKQTQDSDTWKEYKYLRNLVVSQLRKQEKNYFKQEIAKHKGKPSMWKTLNMALGKASKSNSIPSNITANALNNYYVNVGPNLANKFSGEGDLPSTPIVSSNFTMEDIRTDTVLKQLTKLNKKSKLDILGFDSKLLHCSAALITPVITQMFNMSIKEGRLPSSWKTARVTPIYKGKGANDICSNYRPISVLPYIAKVIESCVQQQLIDYLDVFNILNCEQSAYLKNHSTTTSLHKVVDDWLDKLNNGYVNGVAFFDLSKCFDTINHDRLIRKLKLYGITGTPLRWFMDYLSNRTQAVFVNGILSDLLNVIMGVPQGSNLGPILFLLFVNDFPDCLKCTTCNLFADDTAIYCHGSHITDINTTLQTDVLNSTKWFSDNMLTLNIDKSCTIAIGTQKRLSNNNLNILAENNLLTNVNKVKYLGVTIDKNLNWNDHVSTLCAKISPKIGLLRKLKYKIPKDQLITIYQSIIQPHFDYAISVWGQTSKSNINALQRLQNRAARIITGIYDWTESVSKLITALGWMTIEQRVKYFTLILTYKCLNGKAPSYLTDTFTIHESVYNTRLCDGFNLTPPKVNIELFKHSFLFTGSVGFNSLPKHLKQCSTLTAFKKELRSILQN